MKCLPPLLLCAFSAGAAAQNTWIVNPGGGAGVHFTDLPAAVAAAADGDTIRVQWGPFLTGVSGFSTGKGLAILGEGGVHLDTQSTPVTVSALPAGRQFRLVGFGAPRGQPMRIVVQGCAGEVHLEDLHAVEPGWIAPSLASISLTNCALVTLRDVEAFGSPAVQIDGSTAVLAACRLGKSTLGLGGGPCLHAVNANVDVSEPFFQTGWSPVCIRLLQSHLRLGGTAAARVAAGDPLSLVPGTPIVAHGGSVTLDPAVPLLASPATAPTITGTATVVTTFVPATWCDRAAPGQTVTIAATHPANAVLLQYVGLPGPALQTPFGAVLLALSPAPTWLVQAAITTTAGTTSTPIPIPAFVPAGLPLAAQSFVLHAVAELGTAVTFVVH